jgi:hypothetical protein
MSNIPSSPSEVDLATLEQQTLLELRLMTHEAQLRDFDRLRDHLTAHGKDANAKYREIESRRDELGSELRRLTARRHEALRSASEHYVASEVASRQAAVSFPRIFPVTGFWPAYSGTIQMGQANEGRVWNAPGTKGTIYTAHLSETGGIHFGGDVVGAPIEGYPVNPGTYDPSGHQLFLHQWYHVVPFPPPTVDSTLTYAFDVNVQAGLALVEEPAWLYSKVYVGETANYNGQLWTVTMGGLVGWPLNGIQITSPMLYARGQVDAFRSFFVPANRQPAIVVMSTFAAVLDPRAEVIFDHILSFLAPLSRSGDREGVVNFGYTPRLSVEG